MSTDTPAQSSVFSQQLASAVKSYRQKWTPRNPPHPIQTAALQPELQPQLTDALLLEDFRLRLQHGLAETVERFLARSALPPSQSLLLDLVFIEISASPAEVDVDSLVERFPSLEETLRRMVAQPDLARAASLASPTGGRGHRPHLC